MTKQRLARFLGTRILVIGALSLIALGFGSGRPSGPTTPGQGLKRGPYKVTRVVDGDTVVLLIDGKQTKVRLIGVDTPETVHPSKPVEFYGKEATRFTRNLLQGEWVYVEYEAGRSKLDKYGRTLAYLFRASDNLFVNLEIIRQGYGHAYTKYPFRYLKLFRDYQRVARETGRGLWGEDASTSLTTGMSPGQVGAASRSLLSTSEGSESSRQDRQLMVYVTRTGRKYHRAGCRYLSRSMIPISLKEAQRRFAPCSVCLPPLSVTTSRRRISPVIPASGYGGLSGGTGRVKDVYVRGYYRRDGTYVRPHYRSHPRRRR